MWGYVMSKNKPTDSDKLYLGLSKQIGQRESQKLRARKAEVRTIWYGLGMMGLIGWSITIPTIIGIAIGVWLDRKFPEGESWTLPLLVIGLFIGCLNAVQWIKKEDKKIRDEQEKKDE